MKHSAVTHARASHAAQITRAIALLCLVAIAPAASRADPAAWALDKGHHATAMRIWLRRAELGDADAMSNIGYMHEKGLAVRQNYAEAMRWYRQAVARAHHPHALHNLGMLYHHGYGVEQNHREANNYFSEAATQNLPESQHMLGLAHYQGLGKPPNPLASMTWFLSAARLAYGPAQYMVAYLMLSGDLGEEDPQGAWVWASVASARGHTDADELRDLSELRIEPQHLSTLEERVDACIHSSYQDCPGL